MVESFNFNPINYQSRDEVMGIMRDLRSGINYSYLSDSINLKGE